MLCLLGGHWAWLRHHRVTSEVQDLGAELTGLSSDLEGSFDSSLHGCVQADAAEPHLLWFGEKVGSDELGKRTS